MMMMMMMMMMMTTMTMMMMTTTMMMMAMMTTTTTTMMMMTMMMMIGKTFYDWKQTIPYILNRLTKFAFNCLTRACYFWCDCAAVVAAVTSVPTLAGR